MLLKDLAHRRICILGFGREGRAMLQAIEQAKLDCEIVIADQNTDLAVPGYEVRTGDKYLRGLESFDVIVRSPGIFPHPLLQAASRNITNTTQIFLETALSRGALVIGVTGSKGKSTTASLIHHILHSAGKDALLVGNIGEPAIAHVEVAKKNTIFVQEMSSYQLMDMTLSPPIAVVTSFFPEHLDYHGSLDAYFAAKTNITRHQKPDDTVFYDAASDAARAIAERSPGNKVPFSASDCPLPMEQTHLIGAHNERNIAAAFLVASALGVETQQCIAAIRSFHGLPHRLESAGNAKGILWVDDAISTTPESAIAALDALGNQVATILLGGQDRGYDFSLLGKRLAESAVKTAILFPESGTRIRKALERAKAALDIYEVSTMEDAVEIAAKHTPKGSICLLSPASPSYNLFKNFEERGEAFKRAIQSV